MFRRRVNPCRTWAIGGAALVLGLGGCASREARAPGAEPLASPPNRADAVSAQTPVSVSAEVDQTRLPVVAVVPNNPTGHGTEPSIAIVGAEQQSRLEPIRRRPAPLLYGLLTGHEPFLGVSSPGSLHCKRTTVPRG